MTITLAHVEKQYDITHLDHLDRDAALPLVDRIACQGDVLIIARPAKKPATTPIPQAGFPVVRGENGGNTHALFGPGCFTPGGQDLTPGLLTVPEDCQVLLSHPEHGGMLIAPGTYEIRRQREQADEIRLVRD